MQFLRILAHTQQPLLASMKLSSIAILVAITTATIALGQASDVIGWYSYDTGCGSGKEIYKTNFVDGVMTFNQYQNAKSVKMKSVSFSIYTDEGCTQHRQGNGPGGCARLGGAPVRCLKI